MSRGLLIAISEVSLDVEFRVPFLEDARQFLIGDLGPHLNQQVSPFVCPLHLLFFAEAFSEEGVYE